jgi:hypothetical protein
MFEDDDFARRVRDAGYRVVCAEDVFIHHFGRASFSRMAEVEYRQLFERNRTLFEQKWKTRWRPHVYRPSLRNPHSQRESVPAGGPSSVSSQGRTTSARHISIDSYNPMRDASPLFPVGCPRSGTTHLARLLNSHPRILITNEASVFLQLDAIIRGSEDGISAGILFGKEYQGLWAKHLLENSRWMIEGFYRKVAKENKIDSVAYWGDKHPHHSTCLMFLNRLYPDASYIYVVRDPRDAACSIAEMNSWSFRRSLEAWRGFTELYEPFFHALPEDRFRVVRYEDLVSDPVTASTKLLGWLGLDLAPETIDYIERYGGLDANTITSAIPIRKDFSQSSVGRWRTELDDAESKHASGRLREFLVKYGYPDA